MNSALIGHPNLAHAPAYARMYFERLKDEEHLGIALASERQVVEQFIANIPEEKAAFAYAEGKWTIKQLLIHCIEAERVFQYRALRFSRLDATPIPGFDEDHYALHQNEAERTLADILEEFSAVRSSTQTLYSHMNNEMLDFLGKSGDAFVSARSLGWMTIGHWDHHLAVLEERYL